MYRCSLCSYTTRFFSYFQRHSFVHAPEKSIQCNLCGSRFKEKCAYRLHVKEKHGPNAHVCHICGQEFTYQRVLDRHMLCHDDNKPISCSVCGYTCKRRQDLIRHRKAMHSADKPRRKRHEDTVASIFVDLGVRFTREFVVNVRTFAERRSARIDFYIQTAWGFLLFEVDEMQHSSYRVLHEMQRMQALQEYHQQRYPDLYIHIVRYNSHAYKQDGEVKRPTLEDRAAKIRECLEYQPKEQFEISYVYYRTNSGTLAVSEHPEFILRQHARVA